MPVLEDDELKQQEEAAEGGHDDVELSDEEKEKFDRIAKTYEQDNEQQETKSKKSDRDELDRDPGLRRSNSFKGSANDFYNKDKTEPKKNRKKKMFIFGGALSGGIIIVIVVAAILFSFLGAFKYVHFATILRTASFARFTGFMRDQYSQTIFDTAVLSKDSTGSFNRDLLGDRSMYDLIRGVNPEKQLIQLGQDGQLEFKFTAGKKWVVRGTNEFEGVRIGEKTYTLDSYASSVGAETYAKASITERLQIRNALSRDIRSAVSEDLALEGRNSLSALKGIQSAFGFKLVGFTNWARGIFDKDAKASRAIADEQLIEATYGDDPAIHSGNSQTDEAADKVEKKLIEEAKAGEGVDKAKVVEDTAGAAFGTDRVNPAAEQLKSASVIVLVTTGYCVVRTLSNAIGQIDVKNRANAIRESNAIQSRRDQIVSGDVTGGAVSGAVQGIDGFDKSPLYKQDTGQTVTKAELDSVNVPSLNAAGSSTMGQLSDKFKFIDENIFNVPGSQFISHIPILGGLFNSGVAKMKDVVCEALLNPGVQIGLAGAEIVASVGLTGGSESATAASLAEAFQVGLKRLLANEVWVSAARVEAARKVGNFGVQYAVLSAIGSSLDGLVGKIGGADFSGAETEGALYDRNHVGLGETAQIANRNTSYGAPMSNADASVAQKQAMADTRAYYNSKGVYERYFAADNPFSLAGSMTASIPTTLAGNLTNIGSFLTNFIGKIGSYVFNPTLITTMIGGSSRVYADGGGSAVDDANNYFGVNQVGWTLDEQNKVKNDPSFQIKNNTDLVEGNYAHYKDRFGGCYGSGKDQQTDDFKTLDGKPLEHCDVAGLSNDEGLHWRWYQVQKSDLEGTSEDLSVSKGGSATNTTATTTTGATPTAGAVINGAGPFAWPLDASHAISACWNDDRTGQKAGYYHSGLDIEAGEGTPVTAAASGTVHLIDSGPGDNHYGHGYGRVIIITDDDGKTWTQYQHLSAYIATEGQHVKLGDVIARSGSTGEVTGPHLHFNINPHDGIIGNSHAGSLNPLDYLPVDNRKMSYSRGSAAPSNLVGKVVHCVPGPAGWALGAK